MQFSKPFSKVGEDMASTMEMTELELSFTMVECTLVHLKHIKIDKFATYF